MKQEKVIGFVGRLVALHFPQSATELIWTLPAASDLVGVWDWIQFYMQTLLNI